MAKIVRTMADPMKGVRTVRTFAFINVKDLKRTSDMMSLRKLLTQTDFTDYDVEQLIAMLVGDVLIWEGEEFGIKRTEDTIDGD